MKNNTIQEAINNHRKGIYYRKMPREMIDNGYIIKDSDMISEERKALKQIALDNETTVPALLRQWLKDYQEKIGGLRN